MRKPLALLLVPALTAIAVGVFWLSLSFFQSEEISKARGRLSLYHSTVIAELERFSHLTYVLARDPFVIATAQGGSTTDLDQRLSAFAARSGLDAIYLIQPDGVTISASNAGTDASFVGQDYGFRPYFTAAAAGRQGRFYGIGATTGLAGYFVADPVRDDQGGILGVIAIKLALSELEDTWRTAGELVFLANQDGVILLSSDASWRYRVLRDLTDQQRSAIATARQFPGQDLSPLEWEQTGSQRARIGGRNHIHLTSADLPHGWELHYFANNDPALTRSWLVTGFVMILAASGLIVSQFRRTRQIGAALRRSEAEEAQLRLANDRLAVEIDERRTAERRLKRTQDELERAGRLAVLGQLAASVTHELGQPIAAMRNHLTAAELNPRAQASALPRLADLVDRMEGITRQLKFFARSESDAFTEVDLGDAMRASLALVLPNLQDSEVDLDFSPPPQPVLVRGNQLRLEQVITNILRNAVDAVEDSDTRSIFVRLGTSETTGWFQIADSGHGLGDATLTHLQEPFVTTRESGRGMGLGLAISADIIKEHHGTLDAQNRPQGGAVFRIDIPLSDIEDSHQP